MTDVAPLPSGRERLWAACIAGVPCGLQLLLWVRYTGDEGRMVTTKPPANAEEGTEASEHSRNGARDKTQARPNKQQAKQRQSKTTVPQGRNRLHQQG